MINDQWEDGELVAMLAAIARALRKLRSMDEIRRRPTPLKTLLRRHPVVFARRLNEFGENDWEVRQ